MPWSGGSRSWAETLQQATVGNDDDRRHRVRAGDQTKGVMDSCGVMGSKFETLASSQTVTSDLIA